MRGRLAVATLRGFLALLFTAEPARAQGGVGWGVKLGPIFSSFGAAQSGVTNLKFKSGTGFEGGLFIGGNRGGKYGAMLETLYAKKVAKEGSKTTDLHYFQFPFLLRMNGGSLSRSGFSYYGVVGEAISINLKASQDNLDVKDNYKGVDLGLIAGVGIEYHRFIAEGRYDWGLFNVRSVLGGNRVRTKSVIFLVGYRIH